jgi:hypothetical protein
MSSQARSRSWPWRPKSRTLRWLRSIRLQTVLLGARGTPAGSGALASTTGAVRTTSQLSSRRDPTCRNVAVSSSTKVVPAWSADELADRYHAALDRGAADLPADEEPPDRPITLLATAIPRLISLAVATNILHTLPDQAHASDAGVVDELLATIDTTASGSLHRGHLALDAYGREDPTDTADEWLPYVCDETAHALHALSPTAEPPSLIEHAQQAGRYAAIAIGALDRDAATIPETISDCLAHLLTVCVFADAASDRQRRS